MRTYRSGGEQRVSSLPARLTAHELSDGTVFRKPPGALRRLAFGSLIPIATRRG
jgi:hypothetical protein